MGKPHKERIFSLMENAPWQVVYCLHGPYWAYLSLRHGGLTLPALANPGIIIGGLSGESKADLFNNLGPSGKKFLPPFIKIRAGEEASQIEAAMREAGLAYPLIVKPNIGRNGRGVKKVQSLEELAAHAAKFPAGVDIIVQKYVAHEREAGVFYVRKPSEDRGRITSLTLKHFPAVVGDGRATVRELILNDPRASRLSELYFRRHHKHLERIPVEGERYPLTSVGNHIRGAVFEDGAPHITEAMIETFDRIAKEIPGFYFGRFDVRFAAIEDLERGENFAIIEYNGASSEPTHVWDRHTSVFKTYRDMLRHWRYAFEIGAENYARGARSLSGPAILQRYRDEVELLKTYPDEE